MFWLASLLAPEYIWDVKYASWISDRMFLIFMFNAIAKTLCIVSQQFLSFSFLSSFAFHSARLRQDREMLEWYHAPVNPLGSRASSILPGNHRVFWTRPSRRISLTWKEGIWSNPIPLDLLDPWCGWSWMPLYKKRYKQQCFPLAELKSLYEFHQVYSHSYSSLEKWISICEELSKK